MATARPSFELQADSGKSVQDAQKLQHLFENSNLGLVQRVVEFNKRAAELDGIDENDDAENRPPRDPGLTSSELAAQIAYLRKLKFQYLEQNAKDKYVKSIVSDIDDAPIVTAADNEQLAQINKEKKAKLKAAKDHLAEVQTNIRTLAPMVEEDYQKVKAATERAAALSQKIIQARQALTILRQTHPHPRLTIPLAEEKCAEQDQEMQKVSDEIQADKKKAKSEKEAVKTLTLEVESLQTEADEAEKAAQASQVDEDDSRLVPLYEWFTSSLALHSEVAGLDRMELVSENELRLTYIIDAPTRPSPIPVVIGLLFKTDSRKLFDVQPSGLEPLDIDLGDVIDAHLQSNDAPGCVAAILAKARAAAAQHRL